jgi:Tfp pilus assembly protein PilX
MHVNTHQSGAALVVGLVLLLALTLLGISGVNMATLELRMAGNQQAQQLAFQAAETGLDVAFSGPVDMAAPVTYNNVPVGDGSAEFTAQLACAGTSRVPDGIYSENLSARAIHFDATATGLHPNRNATATVTQSIYIIGPAPGNPNFDPASAGGGC